ncbi:acyl-CoA dehydrogenase family protein [Marinobacterium aestuariivivens]|uniref:Acyl-CoA dehydrogenase family protein n=1 Tax=Marinobacterium aestuariivivens TaxID=1698799 RepID=A0ABW2A128_9GAMM
MKTCQLSDKFAETLERIGEQVAENGAIADREERFSKENYALLRDEKIFSALVPENCGGGGHSYRDLCRFLGELAALHPRPRWRARCISI